MKNCSIKRMIISAAVLIIFLLTFATSAFAAEVSVEKVGTMDFDDIPKSTVYLLGAGFYYYDPDDSSQYVLIDVNGKDHFGKTFDNITAVDGEHIVVTEDDNSPNTKSLVKADGKVLIKDFFSYGIFNANENYMLVNFATEKADSSADGYLRRSENGENVFYKGYSRVYDLRSEAFVENVLLENSDSIRVVGDSVFFKTDDGYVFYRADGSEIGTFKGSIFSAEDKYFVENAGGGVYRVYDEELNPIVDIDFKETDIYGEAEVFCNYDDRLVNRKGEEISDLDYYDSKTRELNDCLMLTDRDESAVWIVDFTGKLLASTDGLKDVWYTNPVYGCYKIIYEDGAGGLVTPDGKIIKVDSSDAAWGAVAIRDGSEVYILDDGDFLSLHEVSRVGTDSCLAVDYDSEAMGRALYCTLNGEMLIGYDEGYNQYRYESGYIYARIGNGNENDVYKLIITE